MANAAGITGSPAAVARPQTSGAYLTASALYNAGFRGWPLTIMTAIAGRESNWNPNQINKADPYGGSYGLFQINGSNNPGGGQATQAWASQVLQPQENARAAYQLAGGNSLSGLGNWALAASPANKVVPSPTANEGLVNGKLVPINYTIAPWIPAAITATAQVGAFGPAKANQINNVNAWPATTTSPTPLTSAIEKSLGITVGAGPTNATGCGNRGNLFTLPLVNWGPTWCNVKALGGGLMIAGGALVMIAGLGLIVVAGLEHNGPAAPVVRAGQQTLAGVQRITPKRTRRLETVPPAAEAA